MSELSVLTRMMQGCKKLAGLQQKHVPRAEDLPYWSSPPVQFVYRSTATLSMGNYVWDDAPSAIAPTRPILANVLYFFRHITLTADVSSLDFDANIVTPPSFYSYRLSDGGSTVLFREPVTMPVFLNAYDYRLWWKSQQGNDTLLCAFKGQVVQGPSLVGKASITLTAIISAQEVVDRNFIDSFTENYPDVKGAHDGQ